MATFSDTFTRVDSNTVGGGWTEIELAGGDAAIASNYLQFGSNTNAAAVYQARTGGFGRNNTTVFFTWQQNASGSTTNEQAAICISHDGSTRGPAGIRVGIARTGSNNVSIYDQSGTVKGSATATFSVGTDYHFRWDINSDYSMSLYERPTDDNFIPANLILSINAFTPEASDVANWGFGGRFFGRFKNVTIYDSVQTAPSLVSPVTAVGSIGAQVFVLKVLAAALSAVSTIGAAVGSEITNVWNNAAKSITSWSNQSKS